MTFFTELNLQAFWWSTPQFPVKVGFCSTCLHNTTIRLQIVMGVTMIEIKSLLHNMSLIGSILKSDFGDFSTFSFSFILIFTIPIQKWAAKLAGH